MVGKMLHPKRLFPIVVLFVLLAFTAYPALAQVGEETDYALQEEYRIELNDVGDAHITDTITYEQDWFDEFGYVFEENPNLLSRRYRADSNIGEVENFDVDIDSGDATITVTFDTPGLAYNLADGWVVYGYGDYEVVDEGDDEVTLQAGWTITNEYSLFEPMGLEEEVVIDLPDGALNASFDESTGAIEYDLPYVVKESVLAGNKTVFIIIFALMMALSLILLLYAFTRVAKAPAEAVAVGAPAVTPAQPVEATPASPEEAAVTSKFCKKCGHPKGTPDERFCRKCGTEHT